MRERERVVDVIAKGMWKTIDWINEKLICDVKSERGEEMKLEREIVKNLWKRAVCSLGDNDFYWELKVAILAECFEQCGHEYSSYYADWFINHMANLEVLIGDLNFRVGGFHVAIKRISHVETKEVLPEELNWEFAFYKGSELTILARYMGLEIGISEAA